MESFNAKIRHGKTIQKTEFAFLAYFHSYWHFYSYTYALICDQCYLEEYLENKRIQRENIKKQNQKGMVYSLSHQSLSKVHKKFQIE